VLFDDLGPPWPVHPCWEDYMRRDDISSHIQSELIDVGFDGRFYPSQGTRVSRPPKGELKVHIHGYVADGRTRDS
jgi:hypothetical protein